MSTKSKHPASGEFTFAKIALPLPMDMDFSYLIPEELRSALAIGSVVSVPFRNAVKTGYVTGFTDAKPPGKAKSIQDILYDSPVVNEEILTIARWMSKYYFTPIGEILQIILPVKFNRESVEVITSGAKTAEERTKLSEIEERVIRIVEREGKITPKGLREHIEGTRLYYLVDKLSKAGFLNVTQSIRTKDFQPKKQIFYRIRKNASRESVNNVLKNSPAQRKAFDYISKAKDVSRIELMTQFGSMDGAIKGLIDKSLIEKHYVEVDREFDSGWEGAYTELPPLTADQGKVLKQIKTEGKKEHAKPILLHGVTGSGKTRIYIELIHDALKKGRGVLFLLPEIALTNYFLANLRSQFGNNVAVLHSKMSEGERFDSWRNIFSGAKKVVIGPRSAVFAPVQNLGLVIVDEEHDASYKQHESPPYYHARDLAVYRASLSKSKIILGSATPSMESYFNAETGKYVLATLPGRIDEGPLPEVRLIDRKNEKSGVKGAAILGKQLADEIKKRLDKKEQVLVMLNRRGYSTFIQCTDCGYVESCENCQLTLTFHKRTGHSQCHVCGFSKKSPVDCPDCQGNDLRFSGYGTEQIEESIKEVFPDHIIARMDQDTTRSKGAQRQITKKFEKGKADILVGTQMIAKGFDFANVNLVGVVSADTGLFIPEFRAAEKTFQLMTQVAGRAGRRKERGLVVIQTLHPDHYSLVAAQKHDFEKFYTEESAIRKTLSYPPFGRVILLRFFSESEQDVETEASKVGSFLRRKGYGKYFLGPAPAPIEKVRKLYRWQIFLRSSKEEDKNGRIIRDAAKLAKERFYESRKNTKVNMTVDVDPISLL